MEAPKTFSQSLANVGRMLRALSVSQRLMLIGGAALIAATLWIFVAWIAKPKFMTLYSGLRPEDAQQLASRLAAANIPYELSADGGTLSVAADQLDSARVKTASQGLPRSARPGLRAVRHAKLGRVRLHG